MYFYTNQTLVALQSMSIIIQPNDHGWVYRKKKFIFYLLSNEISVFFLGLNGI